MSVARSSIQRQKEEEEEDEENGNEEVEEQGETESEEEDESDGVDLEEGRRKRVMIRVVCGEGSGVSSSCIAASSSSSSLCCQADECGLELKMAKPYHKRHKVCERHAKAAVVLVNGLRKRFCQQCSRFHEISEFDGTKKSCRERLAGHNRRRRKAHSDLHEKMDKNHQRPE